MDIATIIGLVSSFTLVAIAMGDPVTFLDIPSLIIVVGGTCALMLTSFPLQDVINLSRYSWHCVVPPKPDCDRDKVKSELEKGILMYKRIKSYAQATGWVGVLIGAVIMLKNIDDPTAIGPGAALMLLTALYGTIIAYFIYLPISSKLQVQLDGLNKTS